jgi:hypothetical protein
MKFKICYNGSYFDELIVEGNTIEEIREQAFSEGDKRGWERENCYSKKVED